MKRFIFSMFLLVAILPALAQDNVDPEREKSAFLSWVEDQLSTPNRRISFWGIEGVLSSNARIERISIADREGVWLTIEGAEIVWTRSALLRGRLEVDRLAAQRIEIARRPLPEEGGVPSPESSSLAVPDLPVSVALDEIAADLVHFGEPVFGLESEIELAGSLAIDSGTFATDLSINRLDGPGGTLDLAASLEGASRVLDIDFTLREPEDGVVANLLNLYGKPAIALAVAGAGPVDDLGVELSLDAGGKRVLTGTAQIAGSDAGRRFAVSANGPVGELVNPLLRDLFGASSVLEIDGLARAEGGASIERLTLESGALSLSGSAETATDGFPTRIEIDGRIRSEEGRDVVLPVAGGDTRLREAEIRLDFGGDAASTWEGEVNVAGFATAGFTAESLDIDLGGAALDLTDPARREMTVVVDGRATGLGAEDGGLATAIGERAALFVSGGWRAGEPFTIDNATLQTRPLDAAVAGMISGGEFIGRFDLETADASVLADALDRDLSGAAAISGEGTVAPVTGAFDLLLNGELNDLAIGNTAIDRLLAGKTLVNGRAARDEKGLRAENLVVTGEHLSARANGRFGSQAADIRLGVDLSDLSRISDKLSGSMEANATAKGTDGRIAIDANLILASGSISGRRLSDAALGFAGVLQDGELAGGLTGRALLSGETVRLSTDVEIGPDARRFRAIEFSAGMSRLAGAIEGDGDGLFEGRLDFRSPDLSTLAALLLAEASGQAEATIVLAREGEAQKADIDASMSDIEMEGLAIGSAEVTLAITDLFGVPGVDGELAANEVALAGLEMRVLTATASQRDETTDFRAGARFANDASLAAAGALTRLDGGYRLALSNFDLVREEVLAHLREPAALEVRDGTVTLQRLELQVGQGRMSASGRAGETLDLSLDLDRIPLDVANSVRPDLGLSGTVDGTLSVAGTADRPEVDFDLSGSGLNARALGEAGLSALSANARGRMRGEDLLVDARVSNRDGIDLLVDGTVPLGDGEMALDIGLRALPLAALDGFAPDQAFAGRITGSARLSGTFARPEATFDLDGSGVSARPLAEAGIAPLTVSANGTFGNETVTLTAFSASGAEGLRVSASGRVPVRGSGLAIDVTASVPLSLANRYLSGGASASGVARFEGRVAGSTSNPEIEGTISTTDAGYADPVLNVALKQISVEARLDDDRITIAQARASVASGGAVSARGTIGIASGSGFPADLAIRLDNARYVDGSTVVATLSGDMTVAGPLARDPLVSGNIVVDRAELLVPENIGGAQTAIDVRHVNPPRAVARTVALARADDGTPVPQGRPSVARLDLSVTAANRIFVRGRGLDAELGGSVRLTGPLTDIRPVGGFELIRGRLSILGKRIVFDRGEVTLVGDLVPFVDFLATSESNDVTVFITVTGRVNDPAVRFSSRPELPQDEVLARLIFGRSIAELSVLQVAKLAASAAELAGGGNNSLLDGFRQATGLDELDIITDSGGNAAVRAGRYVRDNIYLGVEAGSSGDTRATINIDITDDLKAKGAAGSDGDSSIGIFFEKDY